jgi:hypothetical protein
MINLLCLISPASPHFRKHYMSLSNQPNKRYFRTFFQLISLIVFLSILSGCRDKGTTSTTYPTNGTPDVMIFSPAVIYVNNPTGNTPNPPQQFSIILAATNSLGQQLIPSASNPIHVDVYGAPNGVISPTSITSSTGVVTFTYSGATFPNNILINAWMTDATNNGAALGSTQILQENPLPCSYSGVTYPVPLTQGLPNELQVKADVGYSTSSSNSTLKTYTLDTGSLGVVVPVSDLPTNGTVIGPGAQGVKYYDSSGNTFSGNYYLATVRVQLQDGTTVQTPPIMVLGINNGYCSGPTSKACYANANPPAPTLRYLGVGFNRNSSTANDLFTSPTANAFLHITDSSNGTDVMPGYYITPKDGTTPTGLSLGINSPLAYDVVDLTPNPAVPGDFNAQPGCFAFPGSPAPNTFCGTSLLDVGIDSMFIDLPRAQWPAGTHDSSDEVPVGTTMTITLDETSTPIVAYTFNAVQGTPPPNSATPSSVQWIDSSQIFVNTGRRPLYKYDYFYQGQCGQVGFFTLP